MFWNKLKVPKMLDVTFVFCNLAIDMNSQEGQSADRISVSIRNENV